MNTINFAHFFFMFTLASFLAHFIQMKLKDGSGPLASAVAYIYG